MKIFNLQSILLIAIIGNANTLMIQPNPFGAGLALLDELPQILGQLHQIHELKKQQEEQNQQQPIEKSIHIPTFQNPFHFVKVFSQQMINNNGQQERKIHKVVQMKGPDGKMIEKDINKTITPEGMFVEIKRHPIETPEEDNNRPNLFDALFQPKRDIQEEQEPNQEEHKPHGFMFEIDIPLKKLNPVVDQEDNQEQQKEVQDNTIDVEVEDKNKGVPQVDDIQSLLSKVNKKVQDESEEQHETVKQSTSSQEQDKENFDIPKLFDHMTFPKVHKEKHPKDENGLFDLFKSSPFDNINEEEPEIVLPIKKHKKKHHKKHHKKEKIVDLENDDILNMFIDEPKPHKKKRKHRKNKLNKMEKEEVDDLINDIVKSGNKKKLIKFLEKQDDKLIDDQLINESVKQALNDQIVGSNDIFDRKLRALNPEQTQFTNPGLLSKSKIKAQFNY